MEICRLKNNTVQWIYAGWKSIIINKSAKGSVSDLILFNVSYHGQDEDLEIILKHKKKPPENHQFFSSLLFSKVEPKAGYLSYWEIKKYKKQVGLSKNNSRNNSQENAPIIWTKGGSNPCRRWTKEQVKENGSHHPPTHLRTIYMWRFCSL